VSHLIGWYTPYEFYLKKEGNCADHSIFTCYVLNYHNRVAYNVYINFLDPGPLAGAHSITVFESNKAIDRPSWMGS